MLCLQGNRTSEMQKVTVIVTTLSKNAIKFSIKLIEVDNFTVGVNSMSSVRGVTAMSPEYRYVDLRSKGNSSLLNVRVHSEDEHVCAIVSVQPAGCPVSDTEDVIRNRVANDSGPGRIIDSKILVELKILVVILSRDHAVVVV